MWKSSISKVLFPHFFVEREVEHFIELFPIHECVGVQERVAANVSGESAKRTLGRIFNTTRDVSQATASTRPR